MVVQLFVGPMYAGKTTKLFNTYKEIGGLIIDYCDGNAVRGFVRNHKEESHECIRTNSLMDVYRGNFSELFSNVNVFINEAQFFPDLLEFVITLQHSKEIRVYGLDGDYKCKPFGQILDIIPYCDTIEKLRGVCVCGHLSIHSKRVTEHKEQILMDETAYVPACRICYNI